MHHLSLIIYLLKSITWDDIVKCFWYIILLSSFRTLWFLFQFSAYVLLLLIHNFHSEPLISSLHSLLFLSLTRYFQTFIILFIRFLLLQLISSFSDSYSLFSISISLTLNFVILKFQFDCPNLDVIDHKMLIWWNK